MVREARGDKGVRVSDIILYNYPGSLRFTLVALAVTDVY